MLHIQILHQPIKLQQISLKNQHRLPFPDYLQMLLIILVKVLMILVLVMSNIPWVKTCPSAKIHRPRSFHCQQQQIRQGNFTNFFLKLLIMFIYVPIFIWISIKTRENIIKFSVVFQIQAIIITMENRSRSMSKPILLTIQIHPRGLFLLAKGKVMVLTGNFTIFF